jgi:DNA-binding LacI/PurR family transcriptional regulator
VLIPVLTEPNFRSYFWAKQTMEGITREATRRKYKIVTLNAESYETIDYDALFGMERRMLIVIGTSISWMPKALTFFNARQIESIFVSFDPAETSLPSGMVRMDYVGALYHLLTYLSVDCARDRIAMYGYNPNSSADNIKLRFFRRWKSHIGHPGTEDVFYNFADLQACYNQFRQQIKRFNSVICANDIVGVSLLSMLNRDGIHVPEDLYMAAFGDSIISERVNPPLTIATLDHTELGRQAVLLFSHLCKVPATASVSARVRSKLIVRASTACVAKTTANTLPNSDADAFESAINFYSDPEAEQLMRAEALLNACDVTDMCLIEGLLEGLSLNNMEQELYLTASALQYRKKRLMNLMGCLCTSEFIDFLTFCRSKHII